MSELIESALKDISAYLNLAQSKIKDCLMSQNDNEKIFITGEIREDLKKIQENVNSIF